jgi:hypothetical protein
MHYHAPHLSISLFNYPKKLIQLYCLLPNQFVFSLVIHARYYYAHRNKICPFPQGRIFSWPIEQSLPQAITPERKIG